jgi:hypothetical protein
MDLSYNSPIKKSYAGYSMFSGIARLCRLFYVIPHLAAWSTCAVISFFKPNVQYCTFGQSKILTSADGLRFR